MKNFFNDILEFHRKFGLEYTGKPRTLPTELAEFRGKFMIEEADEWHREGELAVVSQEICDRADYTFHLEGQLDAVIDLLYVTLGTAQLQGFTEEMLTEAWRRVHEKNMQKVRATDAGQSKRGSTFDVVKPEGWTPPDHTDLIEDCAYEG